MEQESGAVGGVAGGGSMAGEGGGGKEATRATGGVEKRSNAPAESGGGSDSNSNSNSDRSDTGIGGSEGGRGSAVEWRERQGVVDVREYVHNRYQGAMNPLKTEMGKEGAGSGHESAGGGEGGEGSEGESGGVSSDAEIVGRGGEKMRWYR